MRDLPQSCERCALKLFAFLYTFLHVGHITADITNKSKTKIYHNKKQRFNFNLKTILLNKLVSKQIK